MLIFNELTMTLAEFNCEFRMSGEYTGVIAVDEESEPTGDILESTVCMECWVFKDVECGTEAGNKQLFVYIPEMDFATEVNADFIDIL